MQASKVYVVGAEPLKLLQTTSPGLWKWFLSNGKLIMWLLNSLHVPLVIGSWKRGLFSGKLLILNCVSKFSFSSVGLNWKVRARLSIKTSEQPSLARPANGLWWLGESFKWRQKWRDWSLLHIFFLPCKRFRGIKITTTFLPITQKTQRNYFFPWQIRVPPSFWLLLSDNDNWPHFQIQMHRPTLPMLLLP